MAQNAQNPSSVHRAGVVDLKHRLTAVYRTRLSDNATAPSEALPRLLLLYRVSA
jgi:hypothetical protein